MITIRDIDHVVLRVVDLDRVARFYVDILGARFEKHQEAAGLYQLRVGTSLIDLVPVDGRIGRMGGAQVGVDEFLTFDTRQAALARAAGLRVPRLA